MFECVRCLNIFTTFCSILSIAATTSATPLQPPQIVNPVLGGQDVRNVAGNQMDIRNADPRDIRLSNGLVSNDKFSIMNIL